MVIVHENSSITELTHIEAANLFLGIGDANLKPYDQAEKNLRTDFYQTVANLSLVSVRAHWAKQVFTGRGRPPSIIDQSQTQILFDQNSEAITYTRASDTISGTRIVLRMNTKEP